MQHLRTIRLKIASLFEFDEKTPPASGTDVVSLTSLVLKQFGFLPQPIMVTVEGDEVVIQYPSETTTAQVEAVRLAERAGKRAAEGNYEKAISIFKRVLELQPSLHKARRDLAIGSRRPELAVTRKRCSFHFLLPNRIVSALIRPLRASLGRLSTYRRQEVFQAERHLKDLANVR